MNIFNSDEIHNSKKKLQNTENVAKTYDSSRGFSLPTVTAISGYSDPTDFSTYEDLRSLLLEAVAHKASDVFISSGEPISMMKNLDLYALTSRVINNTEASNLLNIICQENSYMVMRNGKEAINRAFQIKSKDEKKDYRFRVNASLITINGKSEYFQIVLRLINPIPPSYTEIGLSEEFVKKSIPKNGLYIIAGRTGDGKSTTEAATLKYILENDTPIKGNIITHNDPIEYTYQHIKSKHSIIVQSEIGMDFKDFPTANREAMRRRPAAVEIGELRDSETINAALELATTGHPVFATIHATSIEKIFSRILKRTLIEEREQTISDIISSCHILISQRLIKNIKGEVFAVREHLIFDENLKNILLDMDVKKQQNYIRQIMQSSDGKNPNISKNFRNTGLDLLEQGLIDQENFEKLEGA